MSTEYRAGRVVTFGSAAELVDMLHQISQVIIAISALRGPIQRITTDVAVHKNPSKEPSDLYSADVEISVWTGTRDAPDDTPDDTPEDDQLKNIDKKIK